MRQAAKTSTVPSLSVERDHNEITPSHKECTDKDANDAKTANFKLTMYKKFAERLVKILMQ